jgi:hypothetical protein
MRVAEEKWLSVALFAFRCNGLATGPVLAGLAASHCCVIARLFTAALFVDYVGFNARWHRYQSFIVSAVSVRRDILLTQAVIVSSGVPDQASY